MDNFGGFAAEEDGKLEAWFCGYCVVVFMRAQFSTMMVASLWSLGLNGGNMVEVDTCVEWNPQNMKRKAKRKAKKARKTSKITFPSPYLSCTLTYYI